MRGTDFTCAWSIVTYIDNEPCRDTSELCALICACRGKDAVAKARAFMERALSIAISGTPGTGKTSLADIFLNEQINVLSVKKLAEEHGYLGDLDSQDGAKEVDIHRLSEEWQHNDSRFGLYIFLYPMSHS